MAVCRLIAQLFSNKWLFPMIKLRVHFVLFLTNVFPSTRRRPLPVVPVFLMVPRSRLIMLLPLLTRVRLTAHFGLPLLFLLLVKRRLCCRKPACQRGLTTLVGGPRVRQSRKKSIFMISVMKLLMLIVLMKISILARRRLMSKGLPIRSVWHGRRSVIFTFRPLSIRLILLSCG